MNSLTCLPVLRRRGASPPPANKTSAWLTSRAAIVTALMMAGWPVIRWYIARMSDGSDEPWGLAALVVALLFAPRRSWLEQLKPTRILFLCVLVAGYTASYAFLPPLAHALIFVTVLSVVVSQREFSLAWWSLLVLSLPIVASLQFYLGYPLRLVTTALCVPLLWVGGLHVTAIGTALRCAGETVIVDAPCSGIHMLWTGLFLAALLACWQQLGLRQSFRLLRRASFIVFVANVLRATALFCIESKLWPSRPWAHEAVGLTLFSVAAGTIVWVSNPKTGTDSAGLTQCGTG